MFFLGILNLMDAMSPYMLNLVLFHDYSMMFITMIMSLIIYMNMFILLNKFYSKLINEHQMIELIWTIIPMMILFLIAYPSLIILYSTDEIFNPDLTLKILGNQWYWSLEISEFPMLNFDMFMINENKSNIYRLLDTENIMILPIESMIRFIVSSNDVIHSFTIPSLGIKMDAVPGRLNQSLSWTPLIGEYMGQCSEMCGINHSFMPIMIYFISPNLFINMI